MIKIEGVIKEGEARGARAEFLGWVPRIPEGEGRQPLPHPDVRLRLLEDTPLRHWAARQGPRAGTEIVLPAAHFRPERGLYDGPVYIGSIDRGVVSLQETHFPGETALDDLARMVAFGQAWEGGPARLKISIEYVEAEEKSDG